MEESEKVIDFLKQNLLVILLLGAAGALFLLGVYDFLASEKKEEVVFVETEEPALIVIDVEGAVLKPGVYELKEGSRVHDALISAGGLTPEADRLWMERNINLASRLPDGGKIYIPRRGEGIAGGSSTKASGDEARMPSLININTASSSELESLSGVGPVTAGKIIEARPYTSIDELLERKVVGNALFEKIKDKIAH